jgi:cadmium resistance protein CadD (predicted permease)
LFFSLVDTCPNRRNIVIGEFLGVSSIIAISLIGSIGISLFIDEYKYLLGFIPIGFGIIEYIDNWTKNKSLNQTGVIDTEVTTRNFNTILNKPTLLKVSLVILADSVDSIGIYVPVFSNMYLIYKLSAVIMYMALIALWCYLGFCFSKIQVISRNIKKFRHTFVPIIFILLGVLILLN